MKKIFISALLGLACFGSAVSVSLAAPPEDVLVLLYVTQNDAGNILTKTTSYDDKLKIRTPALKGRAYHATVGWVKNVTVTNGEGKVDLKESKKLRNNLKKAMQKAVTDYTKTNGQITFAFRTPTDPPSPKQQIGSPADLYHLTASCPKQTCTQENAIVLFPDDVTEGKLKEINQKMYDVLAKFNKGNESKFAFRADVSPANFTPHITLANTGEFKTQEERKSTIVQANANMKTHPEFTKVVVELR